MLNRFVMMAAATALSLPLMAAVPDSTVATHRVSFDAGAFYMPRTSSFFSGNNNENRPVDASVSANVKYSFSFAKDSRQWKHCPGAYQGIGLGFNTFFASSLMGTPVGLYVFQGAPIVRFSNRLTLGYEWNFGASFGWKKYNENSNDMSIIGSRTNAYMNLALLLNYRISPQWQIGVGLAGSHFSNGNTSQPNSGVNTLGLRLGVTYSFEAEPMIRELIIHEPFKPHFSYDLLLFGAWRSKVVHIDETPHVLKGKFGVAGINFAPMYDFHRLFRAGVSLDMKYDESADIMNYRVPGSMPDNPLFYRPPFEKSVSVGLSAKAELVMPIFSIAVGLGHNFISPRGDRRFYQTLALKTYVMDNLFLNVGYQLYEFSQPSNLMLGLGYRFHSSR